MVYAAVLLLSLPAVAGIGYCNDKDPSCAAWGAAGECNGGNAEIVKVKCPHTCRVCKHLCADATENCDEWRAAGYCRRSLILESAGRGQDKITPLDDRVMALRRARYDMMHRKCPTSCGICSPKCADVHASCNSWGHDGLCEQNPDFMHLHCPVTCGVCEGKCKDTENDCPGWARNGECSANPGHSLVKCALSCGTCAAGVCKDTNVSACALWAIAGQCQLTPDYMAKHCPASCGICTNVCEDKESDCSNWAAEGECDSNPGHMHKNCPQSCGVCSRLEAFTRSQLPPGEHKNDYENEDENGGGGFSSWTYTLPTAMALLSGLLGTALVSTAVFSCDWRIFKSAAAGPERRDNPPLVVTPPRRVARVLFPPPLARAVSAPSSAEFAAPAQAMHSAGTTSTRVEGGRRTYAERAAHARTMIIARTRLVWHTVTAILTSSNHALERIVARDMRSERAEAETEAEQQAGQQAGQRAGEQVETEAGQQAGQQAGGQALTEAGQQAGQRAGQQAETEAGQQPGQQAGQRAGPQAGQQGGQQARQRVGPQAGQRVGQRAGQQAAEQLLSGQQAEVVSTMEHAAEETESAAERERAEAQPRGVEQRRSTASGSGSGSWLQAEEVSRHNRRIISNIRRTDVSRAAGGRARGRASSSQQQPVAASSSSNQQPVAASSSSHQQQTAATSSHQQPAAASGGQRRTAADSGGQRRTATADSIPNLNAVDWPHLRPAAAATAAEVPTVASPEPVAIARIESDAAMAEAIALSIASHRADEERRLSGLGPAAPRQTGLADTDRDATLAMLSYAELSAATSNFSRSSLVGVGGFSCVYRSEQLLPGLPNPLMCAVKRLNAGTGRGGNADAPALVEVTKSVIKEVELLEQCPSHPNLLPLLGCSLEPLCPPCLVFPLCVGGTLEDRLLKESPEAQGRLAALGWAREPLPLTWRARLAVLCQIARALAHLHAHQLLHGDIKPSNILLDANGVAYLADFGLARMVKTAPCTGQTSISAVKGSAAFLDPIYMHSGVATELTDAFALGVVVLMSLTSLPAKDLKQRCRHMLKFPTQQSRWQRPGVPDEAAGAWEGALVCGLAEIVVGLNEQWAEDRMPLADVLERLEVMAAAAAASAGRRLSGPPPPLSPSTGPDNVRLCIICEERPREMRFECGHAVCCSLCVAEVVDKHRKCPTCNFIFGPRPIIERGAHVREAPTFVMPSEPRS